MIPSGPLFPPPVPDSGTGSRAAPELPERGIAAHRGASATHPENTLAAFREAIRLGAHQIEFDVRASSDSRLVVIHDATVDRTTNGRGRVDRLTLEQIQRLDAGSWKGSQFRGERVPTLVEVLRIMPSNAWLNVHVKGERWVAAEVAMLLVEEDRLHQSVLAVDAEGAMAAREIHPDVWICDMDRQLRRDAYIGHALQSRADFIQFTSLRGLPEFEQTKRLRDSGLRINYCCVEDLTRLGGLFALGIDFPMVDDAETAVQAALRLGIPVLTPDYDDHK
jgi:hypothetical protein